MSKLQEIREEVSQEFGYIDYGDLLESISYDEPEAASVLDEIARRYATVVAEDALKRAVTRYRASNRILNEPDSEVTLQCILETPIELL